MIVQMHSYRRHERVSRLYAPVHGEIGSNKIKERTRAQNHADGPVEHTGP